MNNFPILEFDQNRESIIEPSKILKPVDGLAERCVLPIYHNVIETLLQQNLLTHVTDVLSAMGPLPVYQMEYEGKAIAVAHPGMCAPLAAGFMEELIAFGCRKFIACGAAGILDSSFPSDLIIIPDSAIRDEGTSYHYIEPSREIQTDPEIVKIIESVLDAEQLNYKTGKTWTTDAIYRETKNRIAKRRAEGCLTVEMEFSALLAVAKFRKVKFGQLLAAADDVSGEEWDPRAFTHRTSMPECLFWLSVKACLKL